MNKGLSKNQKYFVELGFLHLVSGVKNLGHGWSKSIVLENKGVIHFDFSTVSKRVLILRTWTFLAFWVLIFTILVSFTQRMSIVSYLQALVPVCTVGKF